MEFQHSALCALRDIQAIHTFMFAPTQRTVHCSHEPIPAARRYEEHGARDRVREQLSEGIGDMATARGTTRSEAQ
jgi:hypothetical protein